MRNRLRLIMAFIFGILAISNPRIAQTARLTADDLLIKDDRIVASPPSVDKNQLAQDISLLIYAFENGYGGRKYLPDKSLRIALDRLATIPQKNDSIDSSGLCRIIGEILFAIPDNHLAAYIDNKECNPEREDIYRSGDVGKNILQGKRKVWGLKYKKLEGKKIPVLSIVKMPKFEDKSWNGFGDAVKKLKSEAAAIIIDLRGNGGGDDTMGRNMAYWLFGQKFPEDTEVIRSTTAETLAFFINSIRLKIFSLEKNKKDIPEYLVNSLDERMKEFSLAKGGGLPSEESQKPDSGSPFDPAKGYAKPIYLLTDRGCCSSCESIVQAFRGHPYAVTVGQNTGGFVHFGNLGAVVLPNSRVTVYMATDFWKYGDGYFEKVGFAPQMHVDTGKDALDVALEELKKKLVSGVNK